jgi:CrcB protein
MTVLEPVLLVALGGAIGSAFRFLASAAAVHWLGEAFPYGTLIVNLVGAFAIGFVQQVATETLLIPEGARLFLTSGLMGGLTTYSTFSYETVRLFEENAWVAAWTNIVGTTALALALCVAGMAVARACAPMVR